MKNLFLLASILFIFSCNRSSNSNDLIVYDNMHSLPIKYFTIADSLRFISREAIDDYQIKLSLTKEDFIRYDLENMNSVEIFIPDNADTRTVYNSIDYMIKYIRFNQGNNINIGINQDLIFLNNEKK